MGKIEDIASGVVDNILDTRAEVARHPERFTPETREAYQPAAPLGLSILAHEGHVQEALSRAYPDLLASELEPVVLRVLGVARLMLVAATRRPRTTDQPYWYPAQLLPAALAVLPTR